MENQLDSVLTKQDMIDKSYQMLSVEDLSKLHIDTTITGKYFYNNTWYKYMSNIFSDGTVEGQNDVGSYNEGRWKVNSDATFSVEWEGYWEDWTGFAYKVANEIMFFDSTTNKWRTTYTLVEDGKLPIDV